MLTHLNGAYGSVWSHLMFHSQSGPTRYPLMLVPDSLSWALRCEKIPHQSLRVRLWWRRCLGHAGHLPREPGYNNNQLWKPGHYGPVREGEAKWDDCRRSRMMSFSPVKKTGANSCAKPEPAWEYRDEGREIYQGRNSRVSGRASTFATWTVSQVSIAVSRSLYGDVDFNGTIYVANADDNDWVGACPSPSLPYLPCLALPCLPAFLGWDSMGNDGHQ